MNSINSAEPIECLSSVLSVTVALKLGSFEDGDEPRRCLPGPKILIVYLELAPGHPVLAGGICERNLWHVSGQRQTLDLRRLGLEQVDWAIE